MKVSKIEAFLVLASLLKSPNPTRMKCERIYVDGQLVCVCFCFCRFAHDLLTDFVWIFMFHFHLICPSFVPYCVFFLLEPNVHSRTQLHSEYMFDGITIPFRFGCVCMCPIHLCLHTTCDLNINVNKWRKCKFIWQKLNNECIDKITRIQIMCFK